MRREPDGGRGTGGRSKAADGDLEESLRVSYVVGRPCVLCKYGDCVEVCPVECFYEDTELLIINPNECIDCTACEPVCPPKAITAGDAAEKEFIDRAAKFACSDASRRSKKEQVTHGPNWDPKLAGG